MDFEEHDALVRRLKLLSKTQTAFLKLYLHGKLVAAKLIGKRIPSIFWCGIAMISLYILLRQEHVLTTFPFSCNYPYNTDSW
jgi:hypothetical protein